MENQITEFMARIEPYLTNKRKEFHKYPELGFTEYVTTHKLSMEMEKLGFSLWFGTDIMVSSERMGVPSPGELLENEERALNLGVPQHLLDKMKGGHTGLVAQLNTGRPGKNYTFRFDIDALPIEEAESPDHLPSREKFGSERKGIMHACGHDGHASIGLGVAHYIHERREELSGTYTLIFQPAEEGGRGAKAIVEKGWLDQTDYFISGHLGVHPHESGVISSSTTKFLASSKLNVEFKGKSAHAGLEPNEGKNALSAAASAVVHLNGISRHRDGATRVNVGKLNGGSGRNIIADYAYMELETRGETNSLDGYMQENTKRILQASADLYEVKLKIEEVGRAITAESNPEWQEIVSAACRDSETIKEVKHNLPIGASEDVTYMMDRVQSGGGKATFMIFSSPLPAGHHHPYFDFDEKSMSAGVEAIVRTIDYLGKKADLS